MFDGCAISLRMRDRSHYERALEAARRDAPPVRPRASAAVVPWRRRHGDLEVYWIRRSPKLRFMGGFHAFPGGRVGREDGDLPLRGEPRGAADGPADGALPETVLAGVAELDPPVSPAVVGAALRELFEETGLLVVADAAELGRDAGDRRQLAEARRSLLEEELDLAAWLSERGLELDATRLCFAGRWVTPALGPLRFDNRFFLLEWPEERPVQPEIVPGEIVEGEWIAPAKARRRWRSEGLLTAPPILHILEVLAEDGPEGGVDRLRGPYEANLGAYRRVEFRPGVLVFPTATMTLPPATHTNVYLLGHGSAVLVDPGDGSGDSIADLSAAVLATANSLGRRVRAIWLTHHHRDHAAGAAALRAELGVPLLAHPLTGERLAASGLAIDDILEDGQRVVLEGEPRIEIEVLHTPGHARGHLAFLCREGGWTIAGDLVAGFGTIVIDPPEGDMADYLASLEKLRDLDPGILFPAHGPVLVDGRRALDRYLVHRREREEAIRAAWASGERNPGAIVPRVYEDLPAVAVPLAERQVLAHLQHLERNGRLDS